MMAYRRPSPLPPRWRFIRHMLRNIGITVAFVSGSLLLGAIGYHFLAGLAWIDAFLNASMILTGMGPVATLDSPAAKLFAIGYTLYSALAFLTVGAVLLGPVVTRVLHRLHLDLYDGPAAAERPAPTPAPTPGGGDTG